MGPQGQTKSCTPFGDSPYGGGAQLDVISWSGLHSPRRKASHWLPLAPTRSRYYRRRRILALQTRPVKNPLPAVRRCAVDARSGSLLEY